MSRFRFSLPDRAARLPALLALALGAMALGQVVLAGSPPPLPEPAIASARVPGTALPAAAPVAVPPVILSRALFSPVRSGTADPQAAPPDPLGGIVIGGAVTIRNRSYAVAVRPDGRSVNVPVGGRIAGWRLASLDSVGVRLVRGGRRLDLAYGERASPAPAPVQDDEEDF